MPPEGGRGAFLTPLGVIWVNAPSGGRGQGHRGGHCFFERPPRKEKGGAIHQPERARKRSDKTPERRSFENRREVCGRIGTRFRRREGKGVDGCVGREKRRVRLVFVTEKRCGVTSLVILRWFGDDRDGLLSKEGREDAEPAGC